jgi:tRNA G18 (ribose-2'-O)-methylase SpoU
MKINSGYIGVAINRYTPMETYCLRDTVEGMQTALILHNIRSAQNVGSLFRTADAAGVSHIYLTGYTPHPVDRFSRAQKDVIKASLGAERSVAWSSQNAYMPVLKKLRREGFYIVGVEQDARAVDYKVFRAPEKVVFIFGNEVRGLSQTLRTHCGALVEIPMRGKKESLNVAVAAGIVLFNCTR